jgi:predicted porin
VLRIFATGLPLCVCALAHAVYAPIPDLEKGKDITLSLEGGITYNTNIFGAASGAIGSMDYSLAPKIAFNSSLTDQTFFTADYQPTLDYFDNRPGSKAVYSQAVDARLAHAFSKTSALTLADTYAYDQNPEALLNGVPINTDQTLQSNELDGRYTFAPTEQLGLVLKARSVYYDYINPTLGDELNRFENLYGLEFDYSLLPELKAAGEYRHQDIDYSTSPSTDNKHTDFLMAGFDYSVGPQLSAIARVGAEYRHREGLSDETTPYVELSGKYDYAKGSFVSVGYTYSLEETSDPLVFTDEKVNRLFANIQHSFTPLIIGSASVDYEPSKLNGRPGQIDIEEDSTHAGIAATYLPAKNWSVTASYDYDFVDSAIQSRGLERQRIGLSARVQF